MNLDITGSVASWGITFRGHQNVICTWEQWTEQGPNLVKKGIKEVHIVDPFAMCPWSFLLCEHPLAQKMLETFPVYYPVLFSADASDLGGERRECWFFSILDYARAISDTCIKWAWEQHSAPCAVAGGET